MLLRGLALGFWVRVQGPGCRVQRCAVLAGMPCKKPSFRGSHNISKVYYQALAAAFGT